jgi:hypothetical protein
MALAAALKPAAVVVEAGCTSGMRASACIKPVGRQAGRQASPVRDLFWEDDAERLQVPALR